MTSDHLKEREPTSLEDAVKHIGEMRLRVIELETALNTTLIAIAGLENCGVREPCAQCDHIIQHAKKIARSALESKERGT